MHHCCLLCGCLDEAVSIRLPDAWFIYYYPDFQTSLALSIWRQRQLINKWNQQAVQSQQLEKHDIANADRGPTFTVPTWNSLELSWGLQHAVRIPCPQPVGSPVLCHSAYRGYSLSAILLYTSYTDIPNHSAAIPDLFRSDPFGTVHAGIAWEHRDVRREFFQCGVEHACAIWASQSVWFNSKIKDWKIEPNDGINLCGKHTSVIIFVLIIDFNYIATLTTSF